MTNYSDLIIPETHADFTTQLGHLIALGYDSDEALHLDDAHYPIWDENYRSTLNHKMMAHYVFYEIGRESPMQFVFALGRKLNEVMPYYNQLYLSTQLKFDPLLTQDMTSDSTNSTTTQSSAKNSSQQQSSTDTKNDTTTTTHSSATTVHSEFPQTRLDDFLKFATNADQTNSDTSADSTGTQSSSSNSIGQNTTDFTHDSTNGDGSTHSYGYAGMSAPQLIMAWRAAMLNIDMMVVDELEPLFMRIIGTPEPMTPRGFVGYGRVYNGYRY